MNNTFTWQDMLYLVLSIDSTLLGYLGSPTTDEAKNNKLRREEQMADVINVADVCFIAFYPINSLPQKNYKINKGVFQVDYYCDSRYHAKQIVERVNAIVSGLWDMKLVYEGQTPSGVTGVYRYTQRFSDIIIG